MADERFVSARSFLISATTTPTGTPLVPTISFKTFQKGSSRLTLVLRPSINIDRFSTKDFIIFRAIVAMSHSVHNRSVRRNVLRGKCTSCGFGTAEQMARRDRRQANNLE